MYSCACSCAPANRKSLQSSLQKQNIRTQRHERDTERRSTGVLRDQTQKGKSRGEPDSGEGAGLKHSECQPQQHKLCAGAHACHERSTQAPEAHYECQPSGGPDIRLQHTFAPLYDGMYRLIRATEEPNLPFTTALHARGTLSGAKTPTCLVDLPGHTTISWRKKDVLLDTS